MKVRKRCNWHRADIVAELKKRKTSLAAISRKHGKAASTAKNALDKHYPSAEGWIAEALDLKPEDIWPERYEQYL
jgi:Ner family transcriptional regulator